MLDKTPQAVVLRQFEQMPIETSIVVPFLDLSKFAPHEEQLLAGMSVHPRVKHAEVGKLLPFVARHFHKERALAVHDFVVTEHENEVFLERVEQREGDVAVMKPAIDRIETHVLEEVVHPTHVPFESETQAAEISRPRHA